MLRCRPCSGYAFLVRHRRASSIFILCLLAAVPSDFLSADADKSKDPQLFLPMQGSLTSARTGDRIFLIGFFSHCVRYCIRPRIYSNLLGSELRRLQIFSYTSNNIFTWFHSEHLLCFFRHGFFLLFLFFPFFLNVDICCVQNIHKKAQC